MQSKWRRLVLWSAVSFMAGCTGSSSPVAPTAVLRCNGPWWLLVTPGGRLQVGQTARAEASYFWTQQDGGECNRAVISMRVTVTVPGIVSIAPPAPRQAPNLAIVTAENPGEVTFGAEITLRDGSTKMDELHQTILVVPATAPN